MKNKGNKMVLALCGALLSACVGVATLQKEVTATASGVVEIEYIAPLAKYETDGKVYNSKGEEIALTEGTFVATDIDTYRIEKDGKVVKLVKVLANVPDATFTLLDTLTEKCIAGETVTMPTAEAYFMGDKLDGYTVSIYADGVLLKAFENVNTAVSYTFAKATEYEVVYSTTVLGKESRATYKVVAESKPILLYEKEIPQTLSNKNAYELGNIYGFYDEARYPATVTVIKPNGETEVIKNTFTPDGVGEYTLKVQSSVVEVNLVEEHKITVENTNASLFSAGMGITSVVEDIATPTGTNVKGSGVEVTVSGKGAYAYYNQVIDLNALDKTDSVATFYVARNTVSRISKIRARLIDANDPSNSIAIYWYQSPWNSNWCYCLVEFNGYALGLNNEGNGKPRPTFGTAVNGASFSISAGISPFNFSYSVKENAVYMHNGRLKVLDLDDSAMLGDKTPFKGFSSGEVYLQWEIAEDSSGSILVLETGGQSLAEPVSSKSDSFLRFAYDGAYNPNTLYNGAVGYEYTLPTPVDDVVNGNLTVETKLYQKVDDTYTDITEKVADGKFKPEIAGEYKVTYACVDPYGNTIEKEYAFTVNAKAPALSVENEDVTYDLGSRVKAPVLQIAGGTGKHNVEVTYSYENETVTPDINGYLYLTKKGAIAVNVRVSDYLGVTVEKTFYIRANNDVCILEIEEEPEAVFVGREYTLADFTAIDYAIDEGKAGYAMTKTILVDGKEIGSDRKYTFTKTGESVITYIGGMGTAREVRKEVKVTVLPQTDNNAFDVKTYFRTTTGVETLLFQNGVGFNASKDFSIEMPSAIPANGFQVMFATVAGMTNYTKIRFVLEDYQNANQQVIIDVTDMDKTSWTVTLNNQYNYTLERTESTYGNRADQFFDYTGKTYYTTALRLHPQQKMLTTDTDSTICAIGNYFSGDVFTGFDSGLIRSRVEVSGVKSASALVLEGVGNQIMTTVAFRRGDRQGAMIGAIGATPKEGVIGQTVVIPRVVAYDVLQGKAVTLTGYIQTPSGIKEIDPNVDTEFTLTEDGVYNVVYEAKDYYGNPGPYEYMIYCRDEIAPEITLPENIKTEYKVGDKATFAPVQATDNVNVVKTYILIKTPAARTVLTDGTYTFTQKGKYELILYARDKAGNITQKRIVLEVK